MPNVATREAQFFSLAEFCRDGAALAKYMIRARERHEPGFLGDATAYSAWELTNIRDEPYSSCLLLDLALEQVALIRRHLLNMGGSGGIPFDDPFIEFKACLAALTSQEQLEHARSHPPQNTEDWESVAQWESLVVIREGLDKHWSGANNFNALQRKPVASSEQVQLFLQTDDPIAIIEGNEVEKLTVTQHDVIQALLESHPNRLSKRELDRRCGHTDSRKILKRLVKRHPLWASVILFPENPGVGYGIK